MIEFFLLIASACALTPGGNGVTSSTGSRDIGQFYAQVALSYQLSCQATLTRCIGGPEKLSPDVWATCTGALAKEFAK